MMMFLVLQTFIVGFMGAIVRTNIAASLLTSESVDSPRLLKRLVYRYLVFSFHYMLSFMLSHLLISRALKWLDVEPMGRDVEVLFYAVACIPLAALLYYLDRRFMIWTDMRKVEGREQFRRKWG